MPSHPLGTGHGTLARAGLLSISLLVGVLSAQEAPDPAREALARLVRTLRDTDDTALQGDLLRGLRAGFQGRRRVEPPAGWEEASAHLLASANAEVRSLTEALSVLFGDEASRAAMRRVLADAAAPAAERRAALDGLLAAKDPELPVVLHAVLRDPGSHAAGLAGPVLRAFAAYEAPGAAEAILAAYSALEPAERRDALGALAARPVSARALLAAVRAGTIPRTDLTATVARQVASLADPELERSLRELWGDLRKTPEDKAREIERLKAVLASVPRAAADPGRGRAVFARTCQQCHTLFGVGGRVGPDLTGSNRAELDYLLRNIVDPSAAVGKDYRATVVRTKDGRTLSGIVGQEDESALTLVTENDSVLLPRNEIESFRRLETSMMPEGLLEGLESREIADLAAYLRGPAQVSLPATRANAASLFNGRDLAGWSGDPSLWSVESGEIVGRTAKGLARNEFLKSDLAVADFRLTLRVKLTPDAANSGIQFRTEALADGEVKGPQADVGAGWWGKLYEEGGRGLLWRASGERHVLPGEWNLYEVVAVGGRVLTALNGHRCVDLWDPALARTGILALQAHAGGPLEVRFKDLKLEVDPAFELATLEPGECEVRGFRRVRLSDVFFCEGATLGDFDQDGHADVVSGPYVYFGPDFKRRTELYPPAPFDKHGYSDNFFAFVHDFNRDGRPDVLVLGFPGKGAAWYQNPGAGSGPWPRHEVFAGVDNESPTFADLTGDGRPELISMSGGRLGYAAPDEKDPARPWTFHAVTPKLGWGAFTHGLGVGDVNGDGRMDLLEHEGWWEQPAEGPAAHEWTRHPVDFGRGGAQMFAVDIDGDGRNDVVTSLEAHGYGLAWFQQVETQGRIEFQRHLIVGGRPDENPHGVCFSEPHAVVVADLDGDGIPDIVTGKRHWAHGPSGPDANAPAVLYAFRTVRSPEGVSFSPWLVDDDSGVGVQVVAGDANGDGRTDLLVGNKLGTFLHVQVVGKTSRAEAAAAAPVKSREPDARRR
ncbi:MAG: VCBS repeat-containing protein [Planctomycetes bacterium]|nr:VCBS repeat-containing protein [Planctomycetota bacterium]